MRIHILFKVYGIVIHIAYARNYKDNFNKLPKS